MPVQAAPFEALAFYPQRSAPAQVLSLNEPVVSAEIAARVIAIPVRVGDVVAAGTTLARLDCSDYRLARQIARSALQALDAKVTLAAQRVKRAQELASKELISVDLLEERQADLQALQAEQASARVNEEQAQLDASRCEIVSPFKALVTERLSAVGQYATPGSTLVKLVDLEQREISAQVFAPDAVRFDQVQQFYLEHNGQRYPLRLRRVLPVIDAKTRNREVRLEFSEKWALPGAAGKLMWQDPRPHLPAEVWVKRNDQLGVFVLQGEQARFVAVPQARMGRANVAELPADTQVITAGHYALTPGQSVEVLE